MQLIPGAIPESLEHLTNMTEAYPPIIHPIGESTGRAELNRALTTNSRYSLYNTRVSQFRAEHGVLTRHLTLKSNRRTRCLTTLLRADNRISYSFTCGIQGIFYSMSLRIFEGFTKKIIVLQFPFTDSLRHLVHAIIHVALPCSPSMSRTCKFSFVGYMCLPSLRKQRGALPNRIDLSILTIT